MDLMTSTLCHNIIYKIMLLKVDNRERDLIDALASNIAKNPKFSGITLQVEALPIGDFILCNGKTETKPETELIIIERKTLRDLASSIKDGRYEEQSYRLSGNEIPNHNIFYLIEGNMTRFKMVAKDKGEASTLYSAMFSLAYTKGFSIIRTDAADETALVLCQMAYKLGKCIAEKKDPFANASVTEDYCNVVKKVKKQNITEGNIGSIMLSQVPGISSVTAVAIMNRFSTIPELVRCLREEPDCLKHLKYETSKGSSRNISGTVKESIIKYFGPALQSS